MTANAPIDKVLSIGGWHDKSCQWINRPYGGIGQTKYPCDCGTWDEEAKEIEKENAYNLPEYSEWKGSFKKLFKEDIERLYGPKSDKEEGKL